MYSKKCGFPIKGRKYDLLRSLQTMSESPLENLPDEVILNILGYVKIQDLINSGSAEKPGHQNATPVLFWTITTKN